MIIVADSGSTSTDWRVLEEGGGRRQILSQGINPVLQNEDEIRAIVEESLAGYKRRNAEIYFYGAGIVAESAASRVRSVLSEYFPGSRIVAGSDLLGAAIALFGQKEGLVGILGTGSNSGLYDGRAIVGSIPAGGFILGDEGSGAYFGKKLLSDYLKKEMPARIAEALEECYGLTYSGIVEKVYRGQMPSRYLAGFMEFVAVRREEEYMGNMLRTGFREFFRRNILKYGRTDLTLGIVGSVGVYFSVELREAAEECGVRLGETVKSAADGLERYYGGTLL